MSAETTIDPKPRVVMERLTRLADADRSVCKEDLLISKEAAGRPQDLIDAASLRTSNKVSTP